MGQPASCAGQAQVRIPESGGGSRDPSPWNPAREGGHYSGFLDSPGKGLAQFARQYAGGRFMDLCRGQGASDSKAFVELAGILMEDALKDSAVGSYDFHRH